MRFLIAYMIIMCITAAFAMVVADHSATMINNLMEQTIELFP